MLKLCFTLILLSSPITTYALTYNSTMCIDCTKENKDKCQISETGYECFDRTSRIYDEDIDPFFGLNRNPPSNNDLDVCIPQGLEIQCIKSTKAIRFHDSITNFP